MNNFTLTFTTTETSNSTTQSFELIDSLEICGNIIGLLFGLPTNSYIIWLIITGTGNGVSSEFFNLNLSVCELGVCLTGLINILSFSFVSLSTFKYFFLGFVITGRPVFQCLMCVERYLAVVHPVNFLKCKPLRYRVICCTAAWITILGSCFLCLLFSDDFELTLFLSVQFLIFLSIQLFCLVAVLRALKQSGPGERGREKENCMKRRAFCLILITTVSMAIMDVPYIVIGFVTVLKKLIIRALWSIALICYVLAGFVQPVLYLHRTVKLPLSSK